MRSKAGPGFVGNVVLGKMSMPLRAHPVPSAIALILLSLSLLSGLATQAQERGPRQLIVPLADGGYVAFKAETTTPETNVTRKTLSDAQQTLEVFDSQALVDENQIIHRVLVDTEGKPVFGYDLQVSPNRPLKQFKVAARPLDQQFESKLLARNGSGPRSPSTPARISTLPQSSDSQLLDDGDSFALDLLINPSTGIKIVDVVKVTFDRATLWDINPKTLPRDFTLEAVQLTVKEYRLLINGNVVATGKSTSGCAGPLIWFYIPDHGRFIFSLVPRDGYPFQKVGIVADNKIEFTVGPDRYEWIANAPVLHDGGAWNLWVLHDPKYTPLLSGPEPEATKKKDPWDKLDAAVESAKEDARKIREQKQTTFQRNPPEKERPTTKRLRIMVGAADRIENLWPK